MLAQTPLTLLQRTGVGAERILPVELVALVVVEESAEVVEPRVVGIGGRRHTPLLLQLRPEGGGRLAVRLKLLWIIKTALQ